MNDPSLVVPAASAWSAQRAAPPPQPPSLSLGLSTEPSPAVSPVHPLPTAADIPSSEAGSLPASSALAHRTGQSLAHLIELTNAINTRRGSSVQHALPEGVAPSGLQAGRRGRLQAAARRGTWTAFGRQDAASPANHAAAAGGAAVAATAVPVSQRFSSGATAARRFSAAVGMLHSAAAFSDESLSGLAAAKIIDAPDTSPRRRLALLEAAKVRALTPSYARRGGGVLLSASVAGLDLQTGENTHLTAPAPRAASPSKVVARVVMEEDGLAADPSSSTPALRQSRFASTYGMQTEMKRAIALRQPKRAQRDSSFRQQLLLESASMIEGVKPETAAAEAATTAAPVADAPADRAENRSNLLTRRHRRSITAPDVAQLTVRYDWRSVLSKPGSERTEAELTFLQGWIGGLKISFFNGLSPEMLRLICKVVTLSSFAEREWIFRQGEKGEHFFVILQGRVAIVIDKTLKVGEVAGQRESDRVAMEARRERQAREAGLYSDTQNGGVTSVAAEAVQSMLLRSTSTTSSPRPSSASNHGGLQRSPTSPRPGSASSNRKSLNLLSPAANAASRRTSMAPAVQEGSDNVDEEQGADAAAASASATPPITLLSLTPSPRKLGANARKLVRAAKLIGSLTRAQQRVNPGGLALSTGGVLCAACGASGHTDAACPSKATLPSSPGLSGATTPGTATPARNHRGGSAASSAVHSPPMLLTPQRSMATLGSPRGSDQQQQPPSPSPRRSTMLMPPTPREASNEVHSPSPSSAAAAAGGAQSHAPAGPALTHQQYSLGLVSTEAVVAEAGVGSGFGEVALASKTNTRQASVLVLPGHGSCVCLVLHKAAYDVALKLLHESQLTYKLNFTRELFLFGRWSYEKALQFTACYTSAVPVHVPKGHIFYRQRDRADTVFFVVSGSISVQFSEEGASSAPLLLPPSPADDGTPMEGRGRWIGATYIRDEVREAAQIAREKQTKAEEAARLKALQLAQPKWLRRASVRDKRRKHKLDVSPRYMDPTGQSRLYSKPMSAREKDEARVLALVGEDARKVPVLRVGRDADGPRDAEGHSFWELERGSSADASDDSGFSSSSSSEGRSTDTSASDDDEWTIARRAERKRAKLQAKKARRRARRAGMHVEPVYDGMAQAELQASNDGCIATMPRDGATSYQFFKIFFQQDKPAPAATGDSSKQEDERVLRITLKPQLSPAVADADGKVAAIAPHDQFDLFGGNDTCRYPSKHKHTWQASAVIGGNGVSTRARSIVIRPATDPNFQSGFVYVSVFHPLNEAAILAYQAAHKGHMPVAATGPMVQQGPAYELLVETVSAAAEGWPRGSLHTPPRVYELSTLGALDLLGAEEVIVQHEAALASIAAAAAAREGKPAPIGVAAARETVNYTELGRISSAVVTSAGGARVLMMGREHFTNHVRGNMLAELKALLRRQLLARAETLERQRTIVALTEAKVPAPKRYDLKQPIKPTMPAQRPQSAHPLSAEVAAASLTPPLLLNSAEAAAFHHRPDLGSLTMLSQRERAQLEQAYQRGRDHARLKDAVLEQYFSRNPNAPAPALLLEEKKAQGHELWALDKDERAQAQRREILLLLQAEERAEQSLVFKEPAGGAPPLSTQLRLMPGSGSNSAERPGTAPIRRSIAPGPPQPTLMLMPGSTTSDGTLVSSAPSSSSSSSLAPTESVVPAVAPAAVSTRSADDLALAPSSLNDGTFQTMTRLEEKYAALTQQKLAKRLFGDADAAMLLSATPPRHRTRSMTSATRDGPVFGLSGSSAIAGTLSKKGAQMAVGQGLRNHWQRERTEVLFKAKLKADRQAHSAREHPFSDPSLTNAWMYLPSLYDSAAVDPQLNQLAIQLGIPQPKPMSQPRDSARAHRPAVFTADGKPVLDADAYEEQDQALLMQRKQRAAGGKNVARKVSVEEALRIAELKAAAAQGATGEGAEEEKQEDQAAATAGMGTRRASITAAASLACPVPDTLWQSERALLSPDGSPASPPPASRGRPFVAQTELAHLAHLVRFEPPQVASPIPRKFKNKEREQQREEEEKQNLAASAATTGPLQLMPGEIAAAELKPAVAASVPATHRFHPSSRPSSASMFGSFARATPIPAAVAAPAVPSASPVSVDEGSGNASEDDVFSTIFSLTQVAQGASQHNTTRNRQEETAMVLRSSAVDDEDTHRDPRLRSPTSRPATAARAEARGNLFIAPASMAPAVGIPQRQESSAERAEKEAVKAYIREQTAGLSLAARIAQSARTLAGASSGRPQLARAVLRSTRQAHSARRPHVPPSIPNKTRPDAHTLDQHSYLTILQRKQSEAQEQLAKMREAGQRRWSREANKQHRREQYEAEEDAAAAAAASRPMSAVPSPAADASLAPSPPAPVLYWNNQPVSGAFEAQLRAEWDRVDVHEEGEREVATEAARTFVDEAAAAEDQQCAAPPLPPRRPSPPTHSRPASASFVMHASAYSPIQPAGARPTSAFPRPPSAHSAGLRGKIRPQSAVSGH